MANKKSYSRYFIILQEDEKGHSISPEKQSSGYAKIEIKNDKCKVSFYVQNIKREKINCYMFLIANKKDCKKVINLGLLNIDDNGRADIIYECTTDNIGNSNVSMDKIGGAAIGKVVGGRPIFVMSGFASTEIPDRWKEYTMVDCKKKEAREEVSEEKKEVLEEPKKINKEEKEVREDTKEINEEEKEVREDTKEINEEEKEVREDTKEINEEEKEVREETNEVKEEMNEVKEETKEIREETKELSEEKKEASETKKEIRKETMDSNKDIKEVAKEIREELKEEIKKELRAEGIAERKAEEKRINEKKAKEENIEDEKKDDFENKDRVENTEEDTIIEKENNKHEEKNLEADNERKENKYHLENQDRTEPVDEEKETASIEQEEILEANADVIKKINQSEEKAVKEEIDDITTKIYSPPIQRGKLDEDNEFDEYERCIEKSKCGCEKDYKYVDKKDKKDKEDKKAKEDKKNKENKKDKEKKSSKKDIPKDTAGQFFKSIMNDFEEIENVCSEIKDCRWYKIPVKNLEEMCNISNYNKYTVVYYPMINYYPYIKKYGYYMMGLKCDKEGNLKYLTYGLPGKKNKCEQPYGGKTGFVTWAPITSDKIHESHIGYWIMFYDFKSSIIVVPMK